MKKQCRIFLVSSGKYRIEYKVGWLPFWCLYYTKSRDDRGYLRQTIWEADTREEAVAKAELLKKVGVRENV